MFNGLLIIIYARVRLAQVLVGILRVADFHERFGRNFECIFGGIATPLFNNGLLTLERGRIKLTDRGLEMADSVFAEFV